MVYTTSNIFLETLGAAGITHAFVNLGSDHPALLEALATRQKNGSNTLQIITCPNEMVALSAAQGFAQVTGNPAAVIVHVDCGTQALAGAIHNAHRSRTPVFIYAGASPFTSMGELKGSRNEWIFGVQDIPDQAAIVRQYMRHTALIRTGRNVSSVILRALTFAKSDPKGPVYLYAGRETMEEEFNESIGLRQITLFDESDWNPVAPSGISEQVAQNIASALIKATKPLIITSYLGRNKAAVPLLVELSELLAIPVLCTCPSVVNFPSNHPNHIGVNYGVDKDGWIEDSDVILVIDSDVPWIPAHNRPRQGALVLHIDLDPLKQDMNMFHIPAKVRAKADSEVALSHIIREVQASPLPKGTAKMISRAAYLRTNYVNCLEELSELEIKPVGGKCTVPYVLKVLRMMVPHNTLFLNESISNYPLVWEHIQPSLPGSMLTSGGTSLGWALGAAIGSILGSRTHSGVGHDLTCVLVGDGSFLFGIPSTSYWMARKYDTPFLTIIWNNGGWKSPLLSMRGVHPDGVGASVSSSEMHVTFSTEGGVPAPDYGKIAQAAGGAWCAKIDTVSRVESLLKKAIRVVQEERRCAVLDVSIEKF